MSATCSPSPTGTDGRPAALYIEAEVARCVYSSGTAKPAPVVRAPKPTKPAAVSAGFFSTLFSSFATPTPSPGPQRTSAAAALPLPLPEREPDPLEIRKSSVVLAIYSAAVDVRLDAKMSAELHRSTKKNPPTSVRLDLIYVR